MSDGYAGKDWTKIKTVTQQICLAVNHLHSQHIVHDDIKPLNVMRGEDGFLLIDMDGSSVAGFGFAGTKVSSAYVPPEMVHISADGEASVKCYPPLPGSESLYECVPSHPSQDIWALGCTLFEVFTGSKMFLTVGEDIVLPLLLLLLLLILLACHCAIYFLI